MMHSTALNPIKLMAMPSLLAVLMISVFALGVANASQKIQVFELRHRMPEEMLPALQPLLGPDVVMSRIGNKLVVKAERLQLAEIASTIARLDRPARRLMIEFREVALESGAQSSIEASGRIDITDQADIALGRDRRKGVHLDGRHAQTQGRNAIVQRVQTIEGRPAYLLTGESIPIQHSSSYSDGRRTYRERHTEYRDATVGFYVRPQVQDDRVLLDITRHAQRLAPDGRAFTRQDAGSRVQGQIGEWIEFGGVQRDAHLSNQGIAYSVQTTGKNDRRYQIRVTELD